MQPRSSVLYLFDPLATPATSRHAPSPDSDKENSTPGPLVDTSFFGRPAKYPSPIILKRRLVDVGDVTVDNSSLLNMLTEEREPDDSTYDDDLTLRHLVETPARPELSQPSEHAKPSNTRTPFAEMSLECDITPIARTKMYRRQPPSSLVSSSTPITPISSDDLNDMPVIYSTNEPGVSFYSPFPVKHDPYNNQAESPHNPEIPQVTISLVDDASSAIRADTPNCNLLKKVPRTITLPASSELSGASASQLNLRPNSPRTSSQDRNRHSVDLYSSFQLQLQSEEASFDLLNDKISFFTSSNSMDSFLNTMQEGDSFDMVIEEEKLQKAVENIQHSLKKKKDALITVTCPEPEDILQPSISQIALKDTTSPSCNHSAPISPILPSEKEEKQLALSIATTPSEVSSAMFSPSPILDQQLCTPAPPVRNPAPPLPVPALRIVKRARQQEKPSSSSCASATVPLAPSESWETRPHVNLNAHITRQLASGTNSDRIAGPSRVLTSATAPPTLPPSAVQPVSGTGTGPRRVPITDSQQKLMNNRTGLPNPKASQNTIGPRRIVMAPPPPAAPIITQVAARKPPAVSGLKAPARYATGTGTGFVPSALPRPVSRVPAPSATGLVRPRPGARHIPVIEGRTEGQVTNAAKGIIRRVAYGRQ